MSPYRLHQILSVAGVLSFAACSHAAANTPGDRLLAAGPAASDTVQVERAAREVRPLPPDVLHDPAARVMRLQQIRQPIVQRIKRLGEARYRQVVRPDLGRQLAQMGFDEQDVAYFLTDLDRTRGGR